VAGPLIATKLYVPKVRRGLVARPRLLERLRRGADSRLTLLSAPAGFGKTTLLAEWLGETPGEDHSVAWLSLDPSDNEPSSFWTYVVTALQTAVPGVGSGALELIASSPCRPILFSRRCSTSSPQHRARSGWSSTTTTWPTATTSATG